MRNMPVVVLVESLQGHSGRDATTNRFLKTCVIETIVTEQTARRAAELRRRARHGSAVDAIVVALAEPGGIVLTGATKQTSKPSPPTPTTSRSRQSETHPGR